MSARLLTLGWPERSTLWRRKPRKSANRCARAIVPTIPVASFHY